MLNLSRLINRPAFRQTVTITSTSCFFDANGLNTTQTTRKTTAIIVPSTTKDIQMVPEGDRINGLVTVYTLEKLNTTSAMATDPTKGTLSDEITWKGEQWKVIQTPDFTDYGFFKSIASRKVSV